MRGASESAPPPPHAHEACDRSECELTQKAERPAPSGAHHCPACPSLQVSKAVESGGVGKKDEKRHLALFPLEASCLQQV